LNRPDDLDRHPICINPLKITPWDSAISRGEKVNSKK
jgi:hypothetical protein